MRRKTLDNRYKIVYLLGEKFDLKAKGYTGTLEIGTNSLSITGTTSLDVPFDKIRSIDLQRPQGFGRIVRIVHLDSTLWITVPRLNIGGYFVIINFFKTGELYSHLRQATQSHVA